jgi:two-component system sensor histidine kinase UhpB
MRDRDLFFRSYHTALVDYLRGSGESGLENAYNLGRRAIDEGSGLLHLVRAHQRAADTILKSTAPGGERMRSRNAAEEFLMEALSAFEMASRGYLALMTTQPPAPRKRRSDRRSSDGRT